jgi:hypothetical protein
METVITQAEIAAVETTEQADALALVELNANELALVGGGTANVCFM